MRATGAHTQHPAASTRAAGFPYLICYVWSELPPRREAAAIVLRSSRTSRSDAGGKIKRASDAFVWIFTFHEGVAKVESGFDPSNAPGRISGYSMLSKYEFGNIRLRETFSIPR